MIVNHGSKKKIEEVVNFIFQYGGIDGAHHKQWVLDQVLRALLGSKYEKAVAKACEGEDGPNTYEWDTGICP